MPSFSYPRLWHTLGWLLVGLVVVVSLSPTAPDLLEVPESDKLSHLIAYMTLMFWFCQLHREPRRQLWLGVGLFALGVSLEVIQGLLVFRTAELADALSNGYGILIGWCVAKTRLGNSLVYLDRRLLRLARRW